MATNPFATKTDDTTTVTATEINNAAALIPNLVDGVDGGTYTPTSKITIAGAGLELGGTNRLKLASRSLTRVDNSAVTSNMGASDRFTPDLSLNWTAATANAACVLVMPVNVPNGCTVTGYTVTIDPPAGHGALPATMPRVQFTATRVSTAADTSLGTTSDTSANVAAYEPIHNITSGALSVVIDNTINRYTLSLESEGGANALPGLKYIGATVTFTVTDQDDAAA